MDRTLALLLLLMGGFAGVSASSMAGGPLPVTAAKDQSKLLESGDPRLAHNKRLAYDFFRVVLIAHHLDETPKFMRQEYIQHNPNVDTGMDGFLRYFSKLGAPKPIPSEVQGLVSIQAEGDRVTLSFVNELPNYTTTWFDMFRIQDGKIAEHWDCDVKSAE